MKVIIPHESIKTFDIGKASDGSKFCIPKKKAEYSVPPPISQVVAKALLKLSINISSSSNG